MDVVEVLRFAAAVMVLVGTAMVGTRVFWWLGKNATYGDHESPLGDDPWADEDSLTHLLDHAYLSGYEDAMAGRRSRVVMFATDDSPFKVPPA